MLLYLLGVLLSDQSPLESPFKKKCCTHSHLGMAILLLPGFFQLLISWLVIGCT